jgi:hypothetical protein
MAEDLVGPLALGVLNCVKERLRYPVGLAHLAPGNNVAWDDCCNGQLWVRVISVVGASSMSNPRLQPCALQFQVRLGVGVIRCAAVINDQGVPPSAQQMTNDTLMMLVDRTDVMQALICCVPNIPGLNSQTLRIEDWLPQGPQGGCVGGEITITFTIGGCADC